MTGPALPERLIGRGDRLAIVDPAGHWTYDQLDGAADAVATTLLDGADHDDHDDLDGRRVAVLAEPGMPFSAAAFGIWRAGGILVPLLPSHPEPELRYLVDDAEAAIILAGESFVDLARSLATTNRVVRPLSVAAVTGDRPAHRLGARPALDLAWPAVMIHTSGTTGRPKGVVHTHGSLAAMVDGMIEAWAWTGDDRIVAVLPLNHVHGLVNVTMTALAVGAVVEAPGSFDAAAVWERFASGEVTVFMAVPTVYARLVTAWDGADEPTRARWSGGAARLRLMVSGSAALPVSTLARWRTISGHVLLERYGMSELGMVLSNTLARRVPGHVGEPFGGVDVRVVGDDGADVLPGRPGELLVRGPTVFREYWRRPEATAAAFVDGWFRTGDVAVHEPDGYRLLGRSSVDIIKSGGEKISALEIEEIYRTHPGVADIAVVGLPDDEWGQRVAAAVVAGQGDTLDGDELRAWGKQQMAAAKVPTRWRVVADLPRNTLGKVVKADVVAGFTAAGYTPGGAMLEP